MREEGGRKDYPANFFFFFLIIVRLLSFSPCVEEKTAGKEIMIFDFIFNVFSLVQRVAASRSRLDPVRAGSSS